ncbi:hypothetical protein BGW36DRAFT_394934 [Talaromyces proteolyticus]|uniref:L-xylulose reductase n=1 Tax=Talaromyces proteolyticus TaxID=1131652 RepID=A0AAD4Q3W8_9EURO|nr:uncharacterized protein BGW36DRAFT_394934 [Talaromyces proteolyticus]KAH8702248.1 hypothetical protein BGW36DRAFT_394934 [Talaromyces proteolyticus]
MSDGGLDSSSNFTVGNTPPAPADRGVFSLFSLKGRTAIITGAASGIGLAVAQAYAEAGANVAITYNSNNAAHQAAIEIEKTFKVKCKAYQLNIKSEKDVSRVVDQIVSEFNGRLDIFVANAGIPWTQGAALSGESSHYLDVVQTNLNGTFYSAMAAGKHFRRQHLEGTDLNGNPLDPSYSGKSFIATASISGQIVNIPQLQTAYNAAKAGVTHMCKSLAIEWVKFARVNSVSPGYIATEISNFIPEDTKAIWRSKIPMGREATPKELQGAYLYLASDAASYTTGLNIVVDGGYTIP